MLVDTHAHLDWKDFEADLPEVIERARDADVRTIITVGIEPPSWLASLDIATKYKDVYVALGAHPHEASKLTDQSLSQLAVLCKRPQVVAIGEIGLDYYHLHSGKDVQIQAFRRQMDMARQLKLPVSIHSRDADEDTMSILRTDGAGLRGVMHCFSGSYDMAMECISLGFLISIPGPVTYPNAKERQEIARRLPLDSLVIETDCPFLTPQAKRGRRNEPAYVRYVAEKLAELHNLPLDEIARVTTENARRLFKIKPPAASD